jgi:uncharacterized protein (DUF58 family)
MTRTGLFVLVAGLSLVAAGWWLAWPSFLAVGLALLAAVVAGAATVLRPSRLRLHRDLAPDRVTKGGTVVTVLRIESRSRRTIHGLDAVQRVGTRALPTALPKVRPGEVISRAVSFTATERGVFEIGPVEVVRRDPFGLFHLVRAHGRPEPLWVYPRDLRLRTVPSGKVRHLEGPSSDTAPTGDITFHRLREYEAGDDHRTIHWRSTARRSDGALLVRHNVDTSQPYTVVLLDLRPEVHASTTFEEAVDVAASVLVAATAGVAPAQLRTTAGARVGGHRSREARPMLDHLAAVEPASEGDLATELHLLRRERGGTALVVVTGAVADGDLPGVGMLRRRFDRVVLVSVTPDPRPVHFPGVTVLAAHDADEVARGWTGVGGHR